MKVQGGKMGSDAERFRYRIKQFSAGCRCGSCFTERLPVGGGNGTKEEKQAKRKSDLQRRSRGVGEGIHYGFSV
jgi:hypothetical protein